MDRGAWWATVHGPQRVRHDRSDDLAHSHHQCLLQDHECFGCTFMIHTASPHKDVSNIKHVLDCPPLLCFGLCIYKILNLQWVIKQEWHSSHDRKTRLLFMNIPLKYAFCKAHWFISNWRNHTDIQNGSFDIHYTSLVLLLEVPMVPMARWMFSGLESMPETHQFL